MCNWLALLSIVVLGSPVYAEAGPADDVPYFGTKNHVKFGYGAGFGGGGGGRVGFASMTPTLEGRFAIGDDFGIQVLLPFAFVWVASEAVGVASRFEIANPSVAFEAVLERGRRGATIVRGGVSLPLQSGPKLTEISGLEDSNLFLANRHLAIGTYGGFNLWRYMPESLSVFGDIMRAVEADGLFTELGAGLGLLIPTGELYDTELAIQASARVGLGTSVIPFIGLGFVVIPTEYELDMGDGDGFQFGFQAGVIVKIGSARLDMGLQLNMDRPFGTSFDEGGSSGLSVVGTAPF